MKFTLFIFLILASLFCFSQTDENCSNFKKGTYFYNSPNGGEVKFKRTKRKQVETYNDENQRFKFKIEWKSECEYTLTLKNTIGVSKTIKKEITGTVLHCKVLDSGLDKFEVMVTTLEPAKTQILNIYKN